MVFIVIPAYNEDKNLSCLMHRIDDALHEAGLQYKVLAVNDGSTDGTGSVLSDLSKKFPIEILEHEANKGVGAVFKTGLSAAAGQAKSEDVIVILEADGTNEPALIPEMAGKIRRGECDVVIASRFQERGSYRKFPAIRLILSKSINLALRLLFPIRNVRDYTIFFRAYRADLIRAFLGRYKDSVADMKTFAFNAALLINLAHLDMKVEEIPMIYRYDLKGSRSKMNIPETLKEYISFMIRTKLGPGRA